MTDVQGRSELATFVEPGTAIDLENCAREPIHLIGSVQPRGYVLVADQSERLTHVSANALDRLRGGATIKAVLGKDVAAGLQTYEAATPGLSLYAPGSRMRTLFAGSDDLTVTAHRHAGRIIVEFEDADVASPIDVDSWLPAVILDLSRSRSVEGLASIACEAVRKVTGYDRTMVYRFAPDWHGEVIAEARNGLKSSYLGLHFPSSDIPEQARRLYAAQSLRYIEDVGYAPVPLIAVTPEASSGGPVDLSFCSLRSVSPIHIEYLQNMGVSATLVVSLLVDGALWGLLVCHHYAGRAVVSSKVRHAVQTAMLFASAQIQRLDEVAAGSLREASLKLSEGIMKSADSEHSFVRAIAEHYPLWRQLFNVQGLVAVTPQKREFAGESVPNGQPLHIPDEVTFHERFPDHILEAAGFTNEVVGGAVVPLDDTGRAMLLLGRVEQRRLVKWAGNPDKAVLPTRNGELRLHPRKSFELWESEIKDRAADWTSAEQTALRLVAERLRAGYAAAVRRGMEEQLSQAHRLVMLGELSGGIAHDLNNILTAIIGNLELAQDRTDEDHNGRALVAVALDAADRAAAMTGRLLAFARRQALQPRPVQVADVLDQTVSLLRETLDTAITLNVVVEPAPLVFVDPALLENALINLVVNARDALPTGGHITLSARKFEGDPAAAEKVGVHPGRYVEVAVADDGTGMPQEVAERAFEPFFTTKGTGAGTGLGLSMVFGFAQQSGGAAYLESEPGKGTVVKLLLPVAASGEAVPARPPGREELWDGAGRILLVEDQLDVAEVVGGRLLLLGYAVKTVKDASAALELIRESTGQFDLLLSDIGLPGTMDGVALAKEARKLQPKLAVLLMTGYATETQLGGVLQNDDFPILLKPFRHHQLARSVRNCIKNELVSNTSR